MEGRAESRAGDAGAGSRCRDAACPASRLVFLAGLAFATACADAGTAGPDAAAEADAGADVDAPADAGDDAGADAPPSDGPAPEGDSTGDDGGEDDSDGGLPCGDACDPFSIVLLPDTQYYTSKQDAGANNTYSRQARWILDHRESDNIRFVIHLGDVTNANTTEQWAIADAAHDMLDAAGMPYSIVPGNHDYLVDGVFARDTTRFNDYFGPSRFAGRPWYGGSYGSGNESNYALFEVGPMKFMVISLEYGPRKGQLCWAEDLIAAHPDRRVIVVSHCVLTHGGAYDGNCPNVDYLVPGGNGATVWDELAGRHGNVFLVLCGHVGDSEYAPRAGNAGNTVHQVLVDYQFESACRAADASYCTANCRDGTHTGNGWLRELVFSPRENSVHARTLSVEEGNPDVFPGGVPWFFCTEADAGGSRAYAGDPHAADHEFDFAQDLSPTPADVREDLGLRAFTDLTANSVGAGDQLHPVLAGAAGGGSFVTVWEDDTDGNGSFQIYARGFAADGAERFPRITVNADSTGQQQRPAAAVAPDGRFVVAWEDDRDRDGDTQIRVRGFTAGGAERFGDRSVHADDVGQRRRPALAALADGGFLVAWEDDGDGNGVYQIHASGFAADGGGRLPLLVVNSVAAGQQRSPKLGADTTGGFVAVWEDDRERDGSFQIMARGFEPDGRERFADFRVNGVPDGQHLAPALAVTGGGAFVAAWQDDSDGNGSFQIRARTFGASGAERLAEWTVNHHSACRGTDGRRRPRRARRAACRARG